ncbi:hypothetical protein ACJA3J_07435 [Halobacillus sp. SY10]|uniref:hypothetical protein n=1 Tax=Halobacillus sp. SY10 TaxID=3381356 RepID=UPI00387A31B4
MAKKTMKHKTKVTKPVSSETFIYLHTTHPPLVGMMNNFSMNIFIKLLPMIKARPNKVSVHPK